MTVIAGQDDLVGLGQANVGCDARRGRGSQPESYAKRKNEAPHFSPLRIEPAAAKSAVVTVRLLSECQSRQDGMSYRACKAFVRPSPPRFCRRQNRFDGYRPDQRLLNASAERCTRAKGQFFAISSRRTRGRMPPWCR